MTSGSVRLASGWVLTKVLRRRLQSITASAFMLDTINRDIFDAYLARFHEPVRKINGEVETDER